MHIKERPYELFRYFCVKIPHKQNFIRPTISIKGLIKVIKKYSSLWDGGWYVPQSSHLHFLKLSSTKILSTSFGKICFSNILLEIVSRMKIITPPPFLFLSNLYGLEKPSIKNRDSKKVSSSFVSVTTRMSIYFSTVSFDCSNLFLIELIFKLPIIILFEKLLRKSQQNGFHAPRSRLDFGRQLFKHGTIL